MSSNDSIVLEEVRAALAALVPGVNLHGLFELAGIAVAVAFFLRAARTRRRLDDELVAILLGALICGAAFARLSVLGRYLEVAAEPSLVGFLVAGGQSVLGGLAGAYVGVLLTKRLIGYRLGTGDLFAPAVALGLGVGRFGCLLTEPPGAPTGFSWGVMFPAERAASFPELPAAWAGVPLHPSFAYEIAFHFAACAALVALRRERRFEGELLKLYLLAYAVFRFAVEAVRGNPVWWAGLTRSQLFLIPSSLLLAATLVRSARRRKALAPVLLEPADA